MEVKSAAAQTISVPVVNGTTDREALPKHWIAALVQMCCEKAVGKKLDTLGIENYVPTQLEYHRWSDRKKKIERVVIPMVIFIRTDAHTIKRLVTYSFINKLLSYPGERCPAIIPDHQIERLRFMLKQSETLIEMYDRIFQSGQTVRIMRGPLKDLEGELCRVKADKPMVAVQIACLGYACVSIDKADLMVVGYTPGISGKEQKDTKIQKASSDKKMKPSASSCTL